MAVIRSSILFFLVLVLITYQEIKLAEGRLLNLVEKVSRFEGEKRKMQDSNPHLVKQDTMHDHDSRLQTAFTKGSPVEPSTGYETPLLDAGKYYLDSTQQGHSPGVGHPFVSSKDAKKMKEQTNVEGKTHDYSPGVGHSVPTTDGFAKPEAAGDGASVVADKRNAKWKSNDYSPGVGHSTPGSDMHAIGVAMRNNNYRRDEWVEDEKVVIDSHSPGVGHSIQEKHAQPIARK